MKILLFRTDPSVMNIKNYNSQEIGLAKAYTNLGHQCDIVYYNGKSKSKEQIIEVGNGKSIKIYWRKGFSILNNGFFPGIKKIISQYDVIQVSEYYFWASWYVYKKYSKTKKIYIYQGVYDSDNSSKFKLRCKIMDPILLNKKIKNNTTVFTKSELAKESMLKRGFLKVKTVGVGLDTSRFNAVDGINVLFNKDAGRKYLLYVGVLEDRRNITFLMNVFREIKKRYNNYSLVIVGEGNKDYVDLCKEYAEKIKIADDIIYKDHLNQEELAAVYKDCDVFLLPSKYEIFGMVLLEAMHFGLPVVTSYNGGSSTLIQNGVNGIIVNDFNVSDWVNAIEKLNNDSLYVQQMTLKAKEVCENSITWSSIAQSIINTISN